MAEQNSKERIVGKLGSFHNLRGKFNDELAQAIASGDVDKAQILKSQLQGGIEQLKKELDPYQLKFRKELAKDGGWKYVGMFGEEGLARAQVNDRNWTFITKSGDPLIIDGEQRTFSLAYQFKEDRSVVRDDDGFKFLLPDGSFLPKPGFSEIGVYQEARGFSEGLAAVKIGLSDKWMFINNQGYSALQHFVDVDDFSDGLARVKERAGLGHRVYIDKNGVNYFEDKSFRYATNFSEGYAFVYCNPSDIDRYTSNRTPGFFIMGKDGLINLDRGFDEARKFSEGQAAVKGGDAWYYVGHPFSPYLSARGTYDLVGSFIEGVALVRIGDKQLYINQQGFKAFELEYDQSYIANPFQEGVAKLDFVGRELYIDHKGREIKEFGNA